MVTSDVPLEESFTVYSLQRSGKVLVTGGEVRRPAEEPLPCSLRETVTLGIIRRHDTKKLQKRGEDNAPHSLVYPIPRGLRTDG